MRDLNLQVRLKAFSWLEEQVTLWGDVLPRSLLEQGFVYGNERVPLVSPQGIFKPRILDLPLSITTSPNGPYDDRPGDDGYLLYKYRGRDPYHRDNVGLREAFYRNTPLIYFHGLMPGKYLAVWLVYIVGDDPDSLTFKVAVDDASAVDFEKSHVHEGLEARRAYVTTVVRRRLHQCSFRERVLHAYREQCALCRLRHKELLDAAHIVADVEPEGEPTVTNGIALCKLHHAAFDSFILGITPDYTIRIRVDILEEHDGPMLQHGLQGFHDQRLVLPSKKVLWPDRDLLDKRYQKFLSA